MKKIGLFLLALLLIIPFISAIINTPDNVKLYNIKTGDSVFLKQNCVNNTYTNITSITVYGAQTLELINNSVSMTLNSNGVQTYQFSNSALLGQYIVNGVCDENGVIHSWSYNYEVTPSGTVLSSVQISVYIFFLILCLAITYFSVVLFRHNRMSKDNLKSSELYQIKKTNEFLFYMNLLKKKLWIVGVFGIYISLLLFTALLNQLVYNLGLSNLTSLLTNIVVVMSWGLIPFAIFWFAWLIITFYKSTTEIMRHQFGGFK